MEKPDQVKAYIETIAEFIQKQYHNPIKKLSKKIVVTKGQLIGIEIGTDRYTGKVVACNENGTKGTITRILGGEVEKFNFFKNKKGFLKFNNYRFEKDGKTKMYCNLSYYRLMDDATEFIDPCF